MIILYNYRGGVCEGVDFVDGMFVDVFGFEFDVNFLIIKSWSMGICIFLFIKFKEFVFMIDGSEGQNWGYFPSIFDVMVLMVSMRNSEKD